MSFINKQIIDKLIQIIPLLKAELDNVCKLTVIKKSHGNFLTSVDKKIEKCLISNLLNIIPGSSIISEESDKISGSHMTWIIDPIDGTTNYIYGYPYSVSIALQQNDVIIIGFVYIPQENCIYIAERNNGSYKYDITTRNLHKISVRENTDNEGIIIFGMPYNRNKTERMLDIMKKVSVFFSDIKRIGPSSIDICRVAEGMANAYVELDLKLWDIAAGQLILSEAGGKITKYGDLYIFANYTCMQKIESVLSINENNI